MENSISLAMILCLGIFIQSSAGFAAGLTIIPLLLWLGLSIPEAAAAMLVATIPQNIGGVWSLRKSVSFQQVVIPGLTRITFMPLGCFLLVGLQTFPIDRVKQVVGCVVVLVTLAIMWFRPQPRQSLHPIWAVIAFPVSGFLQGLVGMGGPAMVFWAQAHDWNTRQIRGFLFTMYLISILPTLAVLYVFFGDVIFRPMAIATGTIPLLLLSTYFGLRFGDWLGRERLRRITLAMLLLIGATGMASPYLSSFVQSQRPAGGETQPHP